MKILRFTLFIFFLCINNYVLDAQSLTQQQTIAIDNVVVEEMKAARTPGAVISIIKDNQVVYEKSFGLANSQTNIELSDSSIFQVCSVTKIFTALTLLTELKQANINPHDTIGKVIHELSSELSSVTFHQLLTHTSGMIDYWPHLSDYNKSVNDFFKSTGDTILFTKPGKVFSYSNTAYALAGLIIEQLTGKTYAEAVNDAVIKPLKLRNTTFNLYEVASRSFSSGHYYDYEKNMVIPSMGNYYMPLIQAAGGIFSNLQDLERLALCLMNNGRLEGKQLFESNIIEDMSLPYSKNFIASAPYYGYMNFPKNAYGRGLFMFDYGSSHFIGNGGFGTQMTFMIYEPEVRFAMIVISNISGDWLINSFKKIFEVILGESELKLVAFQGTKKEWLEISGKYIRPSLDKGGKSQVVILQKDNKLYINFNNSGEIELNQIDEMAFAFSSKYSRFPVEIEFYRDETGKVAYMRHWWRSWVKIE